MISQLPLLLRLALCMVAFSFVAAIGGFAAALTGRRLQRLLQVTRVSLVLAICLWLGWLISLVNDGSTFR